MNKELECTVNLSHYLHRNTLPDHSGKGWHCISLNLIHNYHKNRSILTHVEMILPRKITRSR